VPVLVPESVPVPVDVAVFETEGVPLRVWVPVALLTPLLVPEKLGVTDFEGVWVLVCVGVCVPLLEGENVAVPVPVKEGV